MEKNKDFVKEIITQHLNNQVCHYFSLLDLSTITNLSTTGYLLSKLV